MTKIPDDEPSTAPDPDSVGYSKPPMQRRFKKSGNQKGRPNGAKNRETIVRAVANKVHTIIEDGERKRRSTLELVLIRLRNMAVEGKNLQAYDELHRMLEMNDPPQIDQNTGCAVVPAEISVEEWVAKAERTNAIMEKYGVRNIAAANEIERRLRNEQKGTVT